MAQTPEQWSKLLAPEALKEYGAIDWARPRGSFDPEGAWTQTWQVWLLRRNARDVNLRGFIRLERGPASGGKAFDLRVKQAVTQISQAAVHEVNADIHCANDALASPLSWSIRTRLVSAGDGREFSQAAVRKDGSLKDQEIRTSATSSWSILEALQRLPGPAMKPLEFTFLDELDKIKPNHRLVYREAVDMPFGEEMVRSHCYCQIGQGLLPWTYYVDDNHRLLLAISGLRAYILDPQAEKRHAELLQRLSRRSRS